MLRRSRRRGSSCYGVLVVVIINGRGATAAYACAQLARLSKGVAFAAAACVCGGAGCVDYAAEGGGEVGAEEDAEGGRRGAD